MLVNYIYDYQYFKLPIMLLIDLNKLQDQWLSASFKKKKWHVMQNVSIFLKKLI